MAIIQSKYLYTAAEPFLIGLQRAFLAILRVTAVSGDDSSIDRPLCTGWLITDSLVVFPDYASRPGMTVRCWSAAEKNRPLAANLLEGPTPDRERPGPALLRLHEPLTGRAVVLLERRLKMGEPVCILQHPQGRPDAFLALGTLLEEPAEWLRYDANTEGGSSGSPVLDGTGRVAGIHIKSGPENRYNVGHSLVAMLDRLRAFAAWPEIAEYHSLTTTPVVVTASSDAPDTDLLAAAVRWQTDPTTLSEQARTLLRPLVVNPDSPRWTLQPDERRQAIGGRSLEDLRHARVGPAMKTPGQRVIDRILAGPPYSLAEVTDDELPYWLQTARWFSDATTGLPTAVEIDHELQRRRVRSRLRRAAGEFRGRESELTELKVWYEGDRPGPLVLTGQGGMGKSALVSRFVESLRENTLLFWLDFDRADLNPEKPESLLIQLHQQATAQIDGVPALDSAAPWPANALALGEQLALAAGDARPIIVLDGFEVAQRTRHLGEVWRLIGMIEQVAPSVRVLIVSRAAVFGVEYGGRPPVHKRLGGLLRDEAAAWLRDAGLTDDAVVARLVDLSRGVPLALKLAVRLDEETGQIADLPDRLPARLVEGVLYRRILDRVIDPDLNEIARDVLVLRRLTANMMPEVLESLPAGANPTEVFQRLADEMALVDNEGRLAPTEGVLTVLRLRPEVRSATLRLLEFDNAARVRGIDERAAAWYALQSQDDVVNAAELVYHRLRLGDVDGAADAWKTGCGWRLTYAEDDLQEDAVTARSWLRSRVEQDKVRPAAVGEWERDAVLNVRAALDRGAVSIVPEILAGRTDRGPDSPLLIFDAWVRGYHGDIAEARALLEGARSASSPIGRDRAVLVALFAARADDREAADNWLKSIQDESNWTDRHNPLRHALAVQAARIRLTVDLYAEVALADRLADFSGEAWHRVRAILSPLDVLLPSLARRLAESEIGLENVSGRAVVIPDQPNDLSAFRGHVNELRQSTLLSGDLGLDEPDLFAEHQGNWRIDPASPPIDRAESQADEIRQLVPLAQYLARLARRRWRLVSEVLFLSQACELSQQDALVDPLAASICGTLAAFRGGEPGVLTLLYRFANSYTTLREVVDRALGQSESLMMGPGFECAALSLNILPQSDEDATAIGPLRDWLTQATATPPEPGQPITNLMPGFFLERIPWFDLRATLYYLLSPDPLEALVRGVLGYPNSLTL